MDLFDFDLPYIRFDKEKPFRLFEAFSGYGSQQMALKRLGVNVEVVGFSEVDKYAIKVYNAIHGEHKNFGGIGSFDRFPKDIDLCTWSFPCQDISLAGKQKGMQDGTRSNYGYVFLDTVKNTPRNERPKILLMENVKALFSKKFEEDWLEIIRRLEEMDYTNYYKVLNAKNYGIPQNRERVFIVSILGEYKYDFPKPYKLNKTLKDYLEENVDEKYFLSDKTIQNTFLNYVGEFDRSKSFIKSCNQKEISNTITTKMDRGESQYVTYPFDAILIPEDTERGYSVAHDGDGVYINRPHQKRGVVQKQMIQTIKTQPNDIGVVVEKLRIRKLTPRECLRLMDVEEKDINIILDNVSNAQAYKLAGNSIVVNVLVEIFRGFFE